MTSKEDKESGFQSCTSGLSVCASPLHWRIEANVQPELFAP